MEVIAKYVHRKVLEVLDWATRKAPCYGEVVLLLDQSQEI